MAALTPNEFIRWEINIWEQLLARNPDDENVKQVLSYIKNRTLEELKIDYLRHCASSVDYERLLKILSDSFLDVP